MTEVAAGGFTATFEQSVRQGKAARTAAPLSSHGDFVPEPSRDPVGLLLNQAESRIPELVPVRHGRMLLSPFTYYCGAALDLADEVVAEIGDSYLSRRDRRRDPRVVIAYEHLQAETDQLFFTFTRDESVRIAFTRSRRPYDSDREMIDAVRTSAVLEVTTAATSREPGHPLLDCEFGGPFDRFRAVHDLLGHVRTGFGFELDDEITAWRAQHLLHGRLARLALATEIVAVNCAISVAGEMPDHRALLLPPHLLRSVLTATRSWSRPPFASQVPRSTE